MRSRTSSGGSGSGIAIRLEKRPVSRMIASTSAWRVTDQKPYASSKNTGASRCARAKLG